MIAKLWPNSWNWNLKDQNHKITIPRGLKVLLSHFFSIILYLWSSSPTNDKHKDSLSHPFEISSHILQCGVTIEVRKKYKIRVETWNWNCNHFKAQLVSGKETNCSWGNSSCHLEYPSSEVRARPQFAVLLDLIEWGAVVGGVWVCLLILTEPRALLGFGSFIQEYSFFGNSPLMRFSMSS